jgi:hypothetical protein
MGVCIDHWQFNWKEIRFDRFESTRLSADRQGGTRMANKSDEKVASKSGNLVAKLVATLIIAVALFLFTPQPFGSLALAGGICIAGILTGAWSVERKSLSRKVNPGEEEIWHELDGYRRDFWQYFAFVFGGLFLIVLGLVGVSSFDYPFGPLALIGFGLVGGLLVFFSSQPMLRPMGELGWWWVMVPENRAAFIMGDKGIWKIIINTSDPEKRKHYQLLVRLRNAQMQTKDRYVLLPPGKGLYFLGVTVWPWRYKMAPPWYEKDSDVQSASKQPVRYLDLTERTWNWLREIKAGGVVPDSGTADPIDISADLFLRAVVWDPYLAVFGADFPIEATRNIILARWRQVVASLRYFAKRDVDETDEAEEDAGSEAGANAADSAKARSKKKAKNEFGALELNPIIQLQAHRVLAWKLKLVAPPFDGYSPTVNHDQDTRPIRPRLEMQGRNIVLVDSFPAESPAAVIMEKFGFLLYDAQVTDLEPSNTSLARSVQDAKAALAKAAAKANEATGDAKATMILADAQAYSISERAKAINSPGGHEILAVDAAGTIASKTGNLTVVTTPGGAQTDLVSLMATYRGLAGLSDPTPPRAEGQQRPRTDRPRPQSGDRSTKPRDDRGGGKGDRGDRGKGEQRGGDKDRRGKEGEKK